MGPEGWSLGDELVALLRRWHWLSAAALVGGLAGWLAGFLLPATYEAEAALSVSFTADAIYLTPDDYKNWQLAELEDFILTDAVLDDALIRLDPSPPMAVQDLRASLDPRWRNAGAWQLVATAGSPLEAEAIARAWSEAALAGIEDALVHAATFNELDRRLTAQARELERVRLDRNVLELTLQDVEAWLRDPEAAGGEKAAVYLAGRTAALLAESGTGPAGDPFEGDPAAWLGIAAAALEAEIAGKEDLLARLHADYDTLGDAWLEERRLSRGFSAFLRVEPHDGLEITAVRVVESAPLSLAGAAAGLFGLIGYRLFAMVLRKSDGESPD